MRVALRFMLCVLVLAPLATGQQQPFTESLEIRLHNLDAIVTDREGNPVKGLSKEDFILLENGVPQEITNFSVYESNVATMSVPGAAPAPEAAVATTPVAPATADAPPPRRFVFFIDEMAIQASARNKLKKHALELVASMRPGDVATVVRPSGASKILQDYTGDVPTLQKSLGKAIDDCKLRMNAPAFRELHNLRRAIETAETPGAVAQAKRAYVDASRARVGQRLGQIRALVTSMASTEGKKILVIITSGLSAQPGLEAYAMEEQLGLFEPNKLEKEDPYEALDKLDAFNNGVEYVPPLTDPATGLPNRPADRLILDLKEGLKATTNPSWEGMEKIMAGDYRGQIDNIARTAAAEGVTIYALEPEVPLMLSNTHSADSKTLGSTMLATHVNARNVVPPEMLNQLLHNEGQTLTSMTEKTGGKWFRGVGAIDDTFKQVVSDLQVYYSLAYRARGNSAAPRKVVVKVKDRPELNVRTRSEVIDRSNARDMDNRVLAELAYPASINDLKMTVNAERPEKKGRSFEVPVEVVIPVEKLTFIRAEDGKYKSRVSLHYATAREEREFVSYGRLEQIIELSDQQYQELRRIRYRYKSKIAIPKGKVRIALGVLDTNSRLSSLQTLSVTAP